MKKEVISSERNTSQLKNRNIKYIVLHYTAGKTSKAGAAAANAQYYAGGDRQASADFFVDDGGIVQYNPDIHNRYTWHCGGTKNKYTKGGSLNGICRNANSIGIEICSNLKPCGSPTANSGDYYFSEATLQNAAELIAELALEYDIEPENIVRHYDVTGKLCPGIIGWNEDSGSVGAYVRFKAMVALKMEEKSTPEISPWAAEAWAWAKNKGITDGTRPKDTVTREELVTMLYRAQK